MRVAVTGLLIEVTVTQYSDDNKVMGRVMSSDNKTPPMISVAEADIPEPVLEWVRQKIGMKGGGNG